MNVSSQQKAEKIIREIKSIRQELESYSLKKKKLSLKEGLRWGDLKETGLFRDTQKRKETKEKGVWKLYIQKLGYPWQSVETVRMVAKKWIKELGYSVDELVDIPLSKLYRAIPYVNSKKDARKILGQARALSFNAFLKWLKDTYR